MKKIIGLTAALLLVLGLAFNLNIKADAVDEHTIEPKDISEEVDMTPSSTSEAPVEVEEETKQADQVAVDEQKVEGTETSQFDEMTIIKDKVDMTSLQTELVEDNPYKRVLLLTDDQGHKQYKTIYVKKKNFLKIIDLHGGLVYKGSL